MDDRTLVHTILKWTFGLVPIVAGLDKFFNILVDWGSYVSGPLAALPISVGVLMGIVGIVEIAAGILVLANPRIGAPIVAAWLALIAINLVMLGRYDIAVRDVVMAISAGCLALLSRERQ